MDTAWMRRLQSQINNRKRLFEVPGCRQSRRIAGMYDRDDEVYGFKNLCVYVDAGLVGRETQIATILGAVDGLIYSYEHYDHTRWLMFFGIDPDKLTTPGPAKVHHGIRSCDWEGSLRKFISVDAIPEPVIVPRIQSSEVARILCPSRHDLGLFFCRSREVFVRSESDQARIRQIGSRCIWIFFGDEETPQVEAGIFIPKLVASCDTQEA